MKKRGYYILVFFFGLLVGFLGDWITLFFSGEQANSSAVDNNGDSIEDSKFYYENGVIMRADHDRNFDGKSDFFEFFENGLIKKAQGDENFDGQLDAWMDYSNGNVLVSKHDTDKNGVPDVFMHLKFGVVNLAVWRPNQTNRVARVDIYTDGVKSRTYADKDGNGLLDTLVIFDEMENELSTETLSAEVPPEKIMESRVRE